MDIFKLQAMLEDNIKFSLAQFNAVFLLLNLQPTLLRMVPVVRNLEVLLVCTAGLTVPTTQKPKISFLCVDQVVNYASNPSSSVLIFVICHIHLVICLQYIQLSSHAAFPLPSHTSTRNLYFLSKIIIPLIFQCGSPSLRGFHPKDGADLGTPLAQLLVSSNYKGDVEHQASKLLFVRNREFPVYVHAGFK
jgi:hypothetical protein